MPGTPLIRLLAQEPHTMTIMMDTKLEPDTKVSHQGVCRQGEGVLWRVSWGIFKGKPGW